MGTVPFCPTRVADPSLHSLTHAYPSHTRRCLHRGRERCPASGRCAAGPARGRSPARPAARTGCTSSLPTLHTPTHAHQRQRVLQRQQLLQRRLVQLRDHVHTAATTPSVHAVDGEDGAVVERLQGYPSTHTRFPTGYLRHGMIADVPVLHRTHFRTHTLRKELRLTLSLHSHILRTLYLSRVQIPYFVYATVASLPNTLHNSVILSQWLRILFCHTLHPHARATEDAYSSSPSRLSISPASHRHRGGTAPPRRCRSPSQHPFLRESVLQQTLHYVTVITGCSVVIFTNSGEVPTRPTGIVSGSML